MLVENLNMAKLLRAVGTLCYLQLAETWRIYNKNLCLFKPRHKNARLRLVLFK